MVDTDGVSSTGKANSSTVLGHVGGNALSRITLRSEVFPLSSKP